MTEVRPMYDIYVSSSSLSTQYVYIRMPVYNVLQFIN